MSVNNYLSKHITMKGLSQLLDMSLYKKLMPSFQILVFYLLVLMVSVSVGYAQMGKDGVDYGLVAGVVISTFLWFQYGKKMAFSGSGY